MSLSIVVSVSLALFVLLGVKISGLQECSLATVMCTENNKVQVTNNFELLHGNFSWKCTRQYLQIDLSCKPSQQKNATRMYCKVSVQKENNSLTRRSVSCKGIVTTKKVITDQNQDQDQILNCEWERSALNISLQTTNSDIPLHHGVYYHCTTMQSNTSLQTSNVTLSTTPTALTTAKWTSGSSAINETLTTLGETFLKSVQTSRNCSATLIQEILMKIEQTVREVLSRILNTPATGQSSFVNEFMALHGIIKTNANDLLTVPDPLEQPQSHGIFSLPRGSIDIGEGRLGIVTVVFKFSALCNDTQALEMDSADTNRSSLLQSPIVSVLAMTKNGSIGALQRNASLKFRIKRREGSSVRCMFLNHTSSSIKPFWSDNGMTFREKKEDNFTTCLTDHLTSFAVLIDYNNKKIQLGNAEKQALDLITKTGSGFAILCLVACIFTFARVRGLSAIRYRIHINLCAALAAAQLVFVTGIEATEIKGVCIAVAVMLHYFFTASFTWMFVEAIHLFLKIVSVFNIRITRLRYYVAIGWGIPVLIVAISVSVHHEGYGTPKLCWLSLDGGFIWAFIIPVVIVISINVFVLVAIIVVRVSLKGNPLSPSENKRFV